MINAPPSDWTEARVATLRQLWLDGLTCAQIARHLGGITRNAVIGKATRLGLAARAPRGLQRSTAECPARRPICQRPKPIRTNRPPVLPGTPIPPPHVDDLARVALVDLEPVHCRYPVGDPQQPGFGFCGLEKTPGTPYCAGHLARCCEPAKLKQRPPYEVNVIRAAKALEPA